MPEMTPLSTIMYECSIVLWRQLLRRAQTLRDSGCHYEEQINVRKMEEKEKQRDVDTMKRNRTETQG